MRGIARSDLDTMQYVNASLSDRARAAFGQGDYGGDNVLIGQALADSLGLRVGDPIDDLFARPAPTPPSAIWAG